MFWGPGFARGRRRGRAGGAPPSDDSSQDESSWDVWPEERNARPDPVLSTSGPGARLMKKMGFEGGGLGSSGTGIREPVAADLAAAAQAAAGREGIGLRPRAPAPKAAEREALFSDSNDVTDTKAFASGHAREAQRAWDRKLRRAMGQPELKPGKRQRKPSTVAGYVSNNMATHTDEGGVDSEEGRERGPRNGKGKCKGRARGARDEGVEYGDDAFAAAFDAKYGPGGAHLLNSDEPCEGPSSAPAEGEDDDVTYDAKGVPEGLGTRTDWIKWDAATRSRAQQRFDRVLRHATDADNEKRQGRKARKNPAGFFGRRNRPADAQDQVHPKPHGAGIAGGVGGGVVQGRGNRVGAREGGKGSSGAAGLECSEDWDRVSLDEEGCAEKASKAKGEFFDASLPLVELSSVSDAADAPRRPRRKRRSKNPKKVAEQNAGAGVRVVGGVGVGER